MLTLFEIIFLFRNLFSLMTTVRFIPAIEVSTSEANKYVKIIEHFNTLFHFYVIIFSDYNNCAFYSSSRDLNCRR